MDNNLIQRIKNARKNAKYVANNNVIKGNKDEVERIFFTREFEYFIHEDLLTINPDELLASYVEYFSNKELPIKTIAQDAIFYRGRIGYKYILGSDDDYGRSFIVPFYGREIANPPSIYASGGRFNRDGTSYLYLADNLETCLAEVHLQIGQACSVAEFICLEQINLIDLTKFENDLEMQAWLNILTQPVHSGTAYKYNGTRFLADVFKKLNRKGIYFSSVQSTGHNIVCFLPSLFKVKEFSERIYTAKRINYDFEEMTDAIREFSEDKSSKYINSYNERREKELEKEFDYLESWIKHRKENEK